MDTPPNSLGMVDKLLLPFPLLSDPKGELIKTLGLWNEEEKVAHPSIIVVDKAGVIQFIYAGEDFADRPGDGEIFEALDDLDQNMNPTPEEPAVRVIGSDTESVGPEKPAQTLEKLVPYYRGVNFTTIALGKRFGAWGRSGKDALREVEKYQAMIRHYQKALDETVKLHREA